MRNGIIFTLFAFLNSGMNYMLIMILAAYLNPDGYGKLNLFTTALVIINVFIHLGTLGYIAISYFRKDREDFRKVVGIVISISSISLLFLVILVLLFGQFLEHFVGFSPFFQLIALFICYFQLFSLISLEIWRLQERPIKYGIYTLAIIILNIIITLILIILFKQDWAGRVYAQLFVGFTFFIISLILLYRSGLLSLPNRRTLSLCKETINYGLPLMPHQISGWLRQGLDRYIVSFFLDVGAVGIFSFAFNFGNIIHMIGHAFNSSNSVYIFKNLSENNEDVRNRLAKQTIRMSLLFLVITIITIVGAYFLIPFFFPKYLESRVHLIPLCFSAMFQCIYYQFVNYLFYFKKTRLLMIITVTVSCIHLILSYMLTRFSPLYTSYITLFSSFIICLLVIIYSQKIYPLYLRDRKE